MFAAHARLRLEAVELDFDIGLESRFRIGSTRRVGAIWDTRFTAPNPGPDERVVIYFVVEGKLRWHEPSPLAFERPDVFVATSGQLQGVNGRRLHTFRSEGSPFLGCELHVGPRDVTQRVERPRRLDLSPETVAVAHDYARLVHGATRLGPSDRNPLLTKLLRRLHADRVLVEDLSTTMRMSGGTEAALWSAMVPFVESLVVGPTLEVMASRTSLSLRQLGRAVDRFLDSFNLPFSGWRSLTRGYRLHLAVLLLSNPDLSSSAIADRCGYSSAEALAHALRAEGLPPPMDLRRRILEAT